MARSGMEWSGMDGMETTDQLPLKSLQKMRVALSVPVFRRVFGRPWAPWAQLAYMREQIFVLCAYLLPPDPIMIFYSAFLRLTSPGTLHCKAKPHSIDQP